METTLLLIIAVLVLINILLVFFSRSRTQDPVPPLLQKIDELRQVQERNLKEEFRISRLETAEQSKSNRSELNTAIVQFRTETTDAIRLLSRQSVEAIERLNQTLEQKVNALIEKTEKSYQAFSDSNVLRLERIEKQVESRLQALNEQSKADQLQMREALSKSFREFQEAFDRNVRAFNDLQRDKFSQLESKQNELVQGTEKKLESIRVTVEEKLEKTLSERLGQSFETVGRQLMEVQRGLGEMQVLAQDVGGLKRVLSNVKMRGGIGEVQLDMLLEQILAPEQYQANVKTKRGEDSIVEFAIRLPGKESGQDQVWLPVDAKFPRDKYAYLQEAYDAGDPNRVQAAQKELEDTIRAMARDISQKYLNPPATTDFGIMFLPFEGIYAEVVRKASLLEEIQRQYKVIITGPSTLAAILNSLQMGFRTLAIQKRSSEVWQVLGAVKKEFENFGGLLSKAQNNIRTGLNQLDDVMGKRTRAIENKLKSVTALGEAQARELLSTGSLPDEDPAETDDPSTPPS